MKTRVVLLIAGFIVGALVVSIPSVSRTTGNIVHYVLRDFLDDQPWPGGGVAVSWDDAEALIRQGHVRSVMIPHSGRITMELDNGVQIESQEPESGAAYEALQDAPNRRWIDVAIE